MADLADVQKAIHRSEVDEGAVGGDRLNCALNNITNLEVLLRHVHVCHPVAADQALTLLVNLQHLDWDYLSQGLLAGEILRQVAGGDEAIEVLNSNKHTPAVEADDLALQSHTLLGNLAHALPCHVQLHLLERQSNLSVPGVILDNQELALRVHLEDVVGLSRGGDGALARHAVSRRLGANVNIGPASVNFEDSPCDHVATLEVVVILVKQLRELSVQAFNVHLRIACGDRLLFKCGRKHRLAVRAGAGHAPGSGPGYHCLQSPALLLLRGRAPGTELNPGSHIAADGSHPVAD
mmetsp:Transcript_1855/g.5398  ORF Transcript_1855/g.5398 Transcript_1855/m.5398 type:complete len:294 (-) Transcript_1855:137-1018(-)